MAGSFALDFFDRNVTRASQLEIVMGVYAWDRTLPKDYVEWDIPGNETEPTYIRRNNCERMFRYLVEVEGYELTEDDMADDDAMFHRGPGKTFWVSLMRSKLSCNLRMATTKHPSFHVGWA